MKNPYQTTTNRRIKRAKKTHGEATGSNLATESQKLREPDTSKTMSMNKKWAQYGPIKNQESRLFRNHGSFTCKMFDIHTRKASSSNGKDSSPADRCKDFRLAAASPDDPEI